MPENEYDQEDERRYYDGAEWGVLQSYHRAVMPDLLELLPLDAASILDVGCGDGLLTNQLPEDREVVGLDISAVALKSVQRRAMVGSALELPFEDKSFDLVMANDVVEHFSVQNRKRVLAEMERVAKHYIIVTTPFTEQLVRGYRNEGRDRRHVNRHYDSFDVATVAAFFEGFDLTHCIFTGDEWADELAPVEYLKRAEFGLAHRGGTIDGAAERLQVMLERMRTRQGAYFAKRPAVIDKLRRRTEIMGLFVRRGHPVEALASLNEKSIDWTSASNIAQPRDLLTIDGPEIAARATAVLPLSSLWPYVVCRQTIASTRRSAEIKNNGAIDFKFGFFADVSEGAQLAIDVSTDAPTKISINYYDPLLSYVNLGVFELRKGRRTIVVPIERPRVSQFGHLFQIVCSSGPLRIYRVKIEQNLRPTRAVIPAGPRYLRREADGRVLFTSIADRNRAMPLWFAEAEKFVPAPFDMFEDSQSIETLLIDLAVMPSEAEIFLPEKSINAQFGAVTQMIQQRSDELAASLDARFGEIVRERDLDVARLNSAEVWQRELSAGLEAVSARVAATTTLHDELAGGLEAVSARVAATTTRHDELAGGLEAVSARVAATTTRHDQLAGGLEAVSARVAATTTRHDELAGGLEAVSARVAATTTRHDELAGRLDRFLALQAEQDAGMADVLERLSEITARLDRLAALEKIIRALRALRGMARRARNSTKSLSRALFTRSAVSPRPDKPQIGGATPPKTETAKMSLRSDGLPHTVTMLVPDDRIDRRVLLQGRTLAKAGVNVTVVAVPFPQDRDLDREQFPELNIVRIDTSRAASIEHDLQTGRLADHHFDWKGFYFYTHQFLEAVLSTPADLVVAHDLPVLPAAIAAADMLGARLFYDAHELYPEQLHFGQERIELYRSVEKALIPIPDVVATVNKSIAVEISSRYGVVEPGVILNAPDSQGHTLPMPPNRLLRDALGIDDGLVMFLFQGSLSLNRNLEALVESMALVRSEDVVLVLMGPGDAKREELEEIAGGLGLLDRRVFFHPAVPQNELLRYSAGADVGVIPYPAIDLNTTLCTPNKLFEFLVAGLPILANDLPELRRFVLGAGAGITCPMSSAEDIARAIDTMRASDLVAFRTAAGSAAAGMTWQAQESAVLEVYRSAMSPKAEA